MSEPPGRVQLRRLDPERSRWLSTRLLCGGGCSGCCCSSCCLHTVGGLIGALVASVPSPPDPVFHAAPAGVAAAAVPALPAPERRVLAAFAVFWAADRLRDEGAYPDEAFAALGRAVREIALRVWDELGMARRPEIKAWIRDRIRLLVEDGLLPPESVAHFLGVLAGAAEGSSAQAGRGSLGLLYRIHQLYLEVLAAVDAGAVPADRLVPLRGKLIDQALQAAARAGAFGGTRTRGRFSGRVLAEAVDLLVLLPAGAEIDGSRQARLEAILAGREPPGTVRAAALAADGPGACPICGDPLTGFAVVGCAACETPHHEACWTYNRRCATFACGSTEALGALGAGAGAGPAPAARPAVRVDLSEGGGREAESRPEARAIVAFWALALVGLVVRNVSGPRPRVLDLHVMLYGSGYLFACALATILGALVIGGPMRRRAMQAGARLAGWVFGGTVLGVGLMILGTVVLVALK